MNLKPVGVGNVGNVNNVVDDVVGFVRVSAIIEIGKSRRRRDHRRRQHLRQIVRY